jgi:SH3-like domain-containing protein
MNHFRIASLSALFLFMFISQPIFAQDSLAVAVPDSTLTAADSLSGEFSAKFWVDVQTLNMRAEPSLNAQVVYRLRYGDMLQVIDENGEWRQVLTGGVEGWVHSEFLRSGFTVWVRTPSLNVRGEPGLTAPIVGRFTQNEEIQVVDKQADWLHVKRGNVNGWVYEPLVSKTEPTHSAADLGKKQDYLDAHPNLPSVIRKAIENSTFTIGMSMDQVRVSMGEPDKTEKLYPSSKGTARWVYEFDGVIYTRGASKKITSEESVVYLNFQNGYLWSWGRDFPVPEDESQQSTAGPVTN